MDVAFDVYALLTREKGRKGSNKCEFTEDTQRTNETYGNAGGNGNQAPGMHCTADG